MRDIWRGGAAMLGLLAPACGTPSESSPVGSQGATLPVTTNSVVPPVVVPERDAYASFEV